jgi:predicted esterase
MKNGTLNGVLISFAFLLALAACADGTSGPPDDTATGGDPAASDAATPADGGSTDLGTVPDSGGMGGDPADISDGGDDTGSGGDEGPADAGGTDAAFDAGGGDDASLPARDVTCADPPPPGADLPDPPPAYSGGTCPALQAGPNTLKSGGADRRFLLVLPTDLKPEETNLPVLFLWHWLGGEAKDFLEEGDVQLATDQMRFIAAIPESKGDLNLFGFDPQWPYLFYHSVERVEEEAAFFDDILACIASQFGINASCVSSAGVSAGALWTDQLAQARSKRLASIISLSGGVGDPNGGYDPRAAARPWSGADHKMPAIVLWGGPNDWCGLSFEAASKLLEQGLGADGHYFVECIHNCKHAKPPLEPPPGESEFGGLWRFFLDHPYWLRDGESPYQVRGLPANLPGWCAVGAGSATIREGECEASGIAGSCF